MELPTDAGEVVEFVREILREEPAVLTFPGEWWWATDFVKDIDDQLASSCWRGPAGEDAIWYLSKSSWSKCDPRELQQTQINLSTVAADKAEDTLCGSALL